MKPVLSLRIASVLTFLHSLLHTINMVFGKPDPGPQQAAVSAMKSNLFPVMGFTRSFWDFYLGIGFATSILLVVESLVFWQLSALARNDIARVRPILWTFTLGYIALAVNSFAFLFPPPVIVELLIALCLGLACLPARKPIA